MEAKSKNSIELKPGSITYKFSALANIPETEDEGKLISWYIPAYDIYYSSTDRESGIKRGTAMVRSFYDMYLTRGNLKTFLLQIHKLGFRSPMHDLTLKELMNHKLHKAKFNPSRDFIPNGFKNAVVSTQEAELESTAF